MVNFSQLIFEFIKNNGVMSVAVAGVIEQVIVPIPSPLVPMAAGFFFVPKIALSVGQTMKDVFIKAALPFSIGSTIGSTIIYLGTWFAGKWLVDKFSKWLGFKWSDVEAIKKRYFRGKVWDEALIFFFRAIPVMPSVLISAVCGAIRTRPLSFYFFTWLGLLMRGMLLGWLGWQSGEALFRISAGLDKWETILSLGLVGLVGVLLFWAYLRREKWLKSLRNGRF